MILLDEVNGESLPVGEAHFDAARITIRELIRARVELEFETRAPTAQVAPGEEEARLNRANKRSGSSVLFGSCAQDCASKVEALVSIAEKGFAANNFFVLVGDRQAESLDQEVDLAATGEAVFLLLTPLQGG